MIALDLAAAALILAGLTFLIASLVGLFRLPDVYTRAHAVAVSETAGLILIFTGLLLRPETDGPVVVRLLVIIVFALLANPTGVHSLVRAAEHQGVEPWRDPRTRSQERP